MERQKKSAGKINYFHMILIVVRNDFSRRAAFEANAELIRKHNLEADLGLHTYTLGMNKYGDMVGDTTDSKKKFFN